MNVFSNDLFKIINNKGPSINNVMIRGGGEEFLTKRKFWKKFEILTVFDTGVSRGVRNNGFITHFGYNKNFEVIWRLKYFVFIKKYFFCQSHIY